MYKTNSKNSASINGMDECIQFVIGALRVLGDTPKHFERFTEGVSKKIEQKRIQNKRVANTSWYNATQIAKMCGLYSLNNNPHIQAVSCILNENIFISEEHMRIEKFPYGSRIALSIQYDDYALMEVMRWLLDNEFPDDVYGFSRTFYLFYKESQL